MDKKIIYYTDELNNEFSGKTIIPKQIDENYKYIHTNFLWNLCAFIMQCIVIVPIRFLYAKLKFKIKYIGKEKLKKYKHQGYFVYVNHTQSFGDTSIPSNPIFPKKNFFIVNPENVSMKILGNIVEMFGAIPIPCNKKGMKNFLNTIKKRVQKSAITIYPEAHIWPYYTKIRPFTSTSFKYPIELKKPSFCFTNTYQSYGKRNNKVKITTYIDGPFFVDSNLPLQQAKQNLRDLIYETMVKRSKNSNFEYIKYIKK